MSIVLSLDGKRSYPVDPGEYRLELASAPSQAEMQFEKGKLDWRQLDKLKDLTELSYHGRDASVVAYVEGRKRRTVTTFDWWESGRKRFDFRALRLESLGVDVAGGSVAMKLPSNDDFTDLRVFNVGDGKLTVHARDGGANLELTLICRRVRNKLPAISGLKDLERLRLLFVGSLDLADLLGFERLASLEVIGRPVALHRLGCLSELECLEQIKIHECYEMDVRSFPPPENLPRSLKKIEFDGLRGEDAKLLAGHLKAFKGLSIRGRRNRKWVDELLDNPFRHWLDDHGSKAGKAAAKAWQDARGALTRMGPRAGKTRVEPVLHEFVEAFNRLAQTLAMDTTMREDVLLAFEELIEPLPHKKALSERYEQWCDL